MNQMKGQEQDRIPYNKNKWPWPKVGMLPNSSQHLIYSITCPAGFVNPQGEKILANPAGDRQFEQLLPLFETWDKVPAAISQKLAGLLQSPLPSLVACENDTLRVTPIWEDGALQGGLLEWRLDHGEEKLHILQEVSRAVNSSLVLEDIFESLGEVLHRYIPYHEASIVILDDSQNAIKILVRLHGNGDVEISGENNAFAGYDPVVDRIVRQPTPQRYTDRQLPDSVVFSGGVDSNISSGIVVPLINKGVVIGLIAMSTLQESGFYYYQQDLLTQVSAQLAVAVENAKLYWQTQAQASHEFLINQLTRSIRQSLDINEILNTAVRELGRVMGISRCFIRYFSEPESRVFEYSLPGTPAMAEPMPDFERTIFQLRKDQPFNPFILNDVRDCPPMLASRETLDANRIKSLAVVPILVRDTLVGTITLHQCDAHRSWVLEDLELLRALAEHLGVALHQAGLFMELDRQKQALEHTLQELQQAQLYLIQSEKMAVLGQFVAGIAHEVNTPLGTMMGNNATLKVCAKRLEEKPDAEQSGMLLSTINDLLSLNTLAGERILEIVRSLRNFARLDESELKTVDVHEGLESTLLLMKSSLKPNISIVRDYADDLPKIQCYPGLLNQVFMNLIINASHALDGTPEGKITLTTAMADCRPDEQALMQIRVTDNGKGIAPEHLARIFDPGFTTKGSGVGTGLGLALCYRIVEKHGGRILVDSTVGQGTVFTVLIPLKT